MSEVTTDKKARLGRGLGSLLGDATASSQAAIPAKPQAQAETPIVQPQTIPDDMRIWNLSIEKLSPGEFQPREQFDKEKLNELAASIKENGILQPITARKNPKTMQLEIVAGERRWRAAQLAGLREVPVIIKNIHNIDALELALIENIQREDLNPMEEAEAYQRLAQDFGLTQQQIADKVGKDRATVANAIRLLSLTKEVRDMVLNNSISAGHAKVLASVQDPQKQKQLAKQCVDQGLSVRKLEKLLAKPFDDSADTEPQSQGNKLVAEMAARLQAKMGTRVQIDYRDGKGKLTIQFYSNEELNKIYEQLID